MEILVLNQNDMLSVYSMVEAIQTSKDALKMYSSKKSNIPLRVNIDVPSYEGQSLYMPGYAEDAHALGIKIISVYPNNIKKGLTSVPAVMVLLDESTGFVCALMDGTCLTRIRTGAISGAATDLLSRKDSRVFALFGTGGQAESQLEAVLSVRPIKEVKVFDLSHERAKNFASAMQSRFSKQFHCTIQAVASSKEAVKNADIITTVTTAKKAVYDARNLKQGVHINGVGSYTPDMQENDEQFVIHADKVFVDTRDGVFNESGDLIIPVANGTYSFDRVTGELGDLVLGNAMGRTSATENTFFKTVGSSILDVVTARRIYEKALKKNMGNRVML